MPKKSPKSPHSSLSIEIPPAKVSIEREREREQNHSTNPRKTSWEDTPTPDVEKTFNLVPISQAKPILPQTSLEEIEESDEEKEEIPPATAKIKFKITSFRKKVRGLIPIVQKYRSLKEALVAIENLETKLEIANKSNTNLQKQLDNQQEENNSPKAPPPLESDKTKNLEKTINDLQEEKKEFEEAIQDLNEQIETQEQENQQLAQANTNLQVQLSLEKDITRREVKSELRWWELTNRANQELRKENQQLKTQLRQFHQVNSEYQENQQNNFQEQIQQLTTNLDQTKQGYNNLLNELEIVYGKLKEAELKVAELEQEIEDNEQFFDATEDHEETPIKPNPEIKENTASFNNRILNYLNQIPNPNYYLKKHLGKAVIFGLGTLAGYQQVKSNPNQELTFQNQLNNLTHQLSHCHQDKNLYLNGLESLYTNQQTHSFYQNSLETQNTQLTNNLAFVNQEIQQIKTKLNQTKESKQQLHQQITNLDQTNQNKTTQINELNIKLASQNNLIQEKEYLLANLAQSQQENSQLNQNLANLQTSQEISKKSWQKKQTHYEKEIENLQKQLGKQEKTHNQELTAKQAKIKQLQQEVQQVNQELTQTKQRNKLLISGIKKLAQKKHKNLNKINQLRVKITNYKQAEEQQEQNIKNLTTKLNETQKQLNQQKQTNQNLTEINTELTKQKEELEREKTELTQKLAKKDRDYNYQLTGWLENLEKYWKKKYQKEQQRDDHTYSCPHNDYDTLKTELTNKNQKIAELEQIIQELRNKPPFSPVNNDPATTPTDNKTESNNNFSNDEELLSIIKQQQTAIKELETKLKNANEKEPQIIIKEVPKVELQKVKNKEFCYPCLFSWIVVILLVLNTMRLLFKKTKKK